MPKTKQSGGRVTMPAEYYGGSSGRYFPEGSSELVPADHAYGKTVPTSHGVVIPDNQMGPNLAPFPNSSGMQTGGSKKGKQNGGRVAMSKEYYGGNSGRYFPEGSSELNPSNHAYGETFASSHGVTMEGNQMGPDLGPQPDSSGALTGGSRSKSGSKRKSSGKKSRSRSKSRSGRKSKGKKSRSHRKSKGRKSRSHRKSKGRKSRSRSRPRGQGTKTSRRRSRPSPGFGRGQFAKRSSSTGRKRRLSSRSNALRRREKRLSSRSRRVGRREKRLSSVARKLRNKPKIMKKVVVEPGYKVRQRSYGYTEPVYGDRY